MRSVFSLLELRVALPLGVAGAVLFALPLQLIKRDVYWYHQVLVLAPVALYLVAIGYLALNRAANWFATTALTVSAAWAITALLGFPILVLLGTLASRRDGSYLGILVTPGAVAGLWKPIIVGAVVISLLAGMLGGILRLIFRSPAA